MKWISSWALSVPLPLVFPHFKNQMIPNVDDMYTLIAVIAESHVDIQRGGRKPRLGYQGSLYTVPCLTGPTISVDVCTPKRKQHQQQDKQNRRLLPCVLVCLCVVVVDFKLGLFFMSLFFF